MVKQLNKIRYWFSVIDIWGVIIMKEKISKLIRKLFSKCSQSILANVDFSYMEEVRNGRKYLKKDTKGYRKKYTNT